jgi:dTDP-4-dehydrorhamnose 3,5-epimerase-like enzyme
MDKIIGPESINEPTFIKVETISDDRGYLVPFTDYVDDSLFKRSYTVGDYGTGVIRGLHYHQLEWKVFTIARGAAKFVTVRLEPEDVAMLIEKRDSHPLSSNEWWHTDTDTSNNLKRQILNDLFRDHIATKEIKPQTFVMSDRHHGVLVIPPYYANGWISLEDNTVLTSLSSLRFEDAKNDDFRLSPEIVDVSNWETIGR